MIGFIVQQYNFIILMKMASSGKIENRQLQKKSEVVTDITHASIRSYKLDYTPIMKHLNLDIFKLYPCSNPTQHNHKRCVFYHNSKDRKRYGEFYSQNMCPYIQKGEKCQYGQSCTNSHSRVQQLYQEQTYKKKFCSHYPKNILDCQYGQYCSFAHNEEQVLVQLIHNYQFDDDFYMFYHKTVFCPFNLTEHDKALCVYAHNFQDYRRRPSICSYQPIACFNWNMKDFITDYINGCENGWNCTMCHGWKQLHYHPSYYRTNKCQQPGCKKGQCPNYHSENQKRIIPNDVFSKYFKIIPMNKIVEGVFKLDEKKQGFVSKPGFQRQAKSMFDKVQTSQSKKSKATVIQSPTKSSKGWINNSPIDSEDEVENIQSQTHIQKLLQGQ